MRARRRVFALSVSVGGLVSRLLVCGGYDNASRVTPDAVRSLGCRQKETRRNGCKRRILSLPEPRIGAPL